MSRISAETVKRAAMHAVADLVGIATADRFKDYPEYRRMGKESMNELLVVEMNRGTYNIFIRKGWRHCFFICPN